MIPNIPIRRLIYGYIGFIVLVVSAVAYVIGHFIRKFW